MDTLLKIGYMRDAYNRITRGIHFLIRTFVTPRSRDEDVARREFILNIILIGSIVLTFFLEIILLYSWMTKGEDYRGTPPELFSLVTFFFVFLLYLSRKGYSKQTSYTLIGLYYLGLFYTAFEWGFQLPFAVLGNVIIIVVASILISTRFSFFMTLVVSLSMIGLGYAQIEGIFNPRLYWMSETAKLKEPIEYAAAYFLVTTVSWLSNREIIKSLKRARHSENLLIKERDNLEITVEERTRELRKTQFEKVSQLYHFAELGKLSSGVYHDLMSSVQAINLYAGELDQVIDPRVYDVKKLLEKSIRATQRMENFMSSVRKQTQQNDCEKIFNINEEIEQAIELLSPKARHNHADIYFDAATPYTLYGNPYKFHQIVVNLISNAIDSYQGIPLKNDSRREARLSLTRFDDRICLKVSDDGCGISPHLTTKIFDPFFTTKSGNGTGIGLANTKESVEYFKGSISVSSTENKGTTFTVTFPLHHESRAETSQSRRNYSNRPKERRQF